LSRINKNTLLQTNFWPFCPLRNDTINYSASALNEYFENKKYISVTIRVWDS